MSFAERLKRIRKMRGFTQESLAEKVGVSRNTIAGYEAPSKNREPDFDVTARLAQVLNVPIGQLMEDEVAKDSPAYNPMPNTITDPLTVEQKFSNIEGTLQKIKFIPLIGIVIGIVIAGQLSFAAQHIEGQIAVPEFWNIDFALKIKGDSLIDKGICEGDIAVCVKYDGQTVNPGDLIVVARQDDVTVKFLAQKDGQWVLRAANPKYPDIPFNGEDRIQAIVVKIMRDAPRL